MDRFDREFYTVGGVVLWESLVYFNSITQIYQFNLMQSQTVTAIPD